MTKLILTGALILLSIIDLIVVVINNEDEEIYPVDYYTPAVKIATFVSRENIHGLLRYESFHTTHM